MRIAGDIMAPKLSEGLEEGGCAFPADGAVINGHLRPDKSAADGGNDDVNKFSIRGLETLRHGSDIVRVALDNSEIRRGTSWEDGHKLRRGTAEGDALVAGAKGMLECRESYACARPEECNGLDAATHCVGLLRGMSELGENDRRLWQALSVFKAGTSQTGSTF